MSGAAHEDGSPYPLGPEGETHWRRREGGVKPRGPSLGGMTVTTTAPPPAVRTEGLTRTFGSFTAVDSLDLEIPAGIVYGLLGPNGAGKSTALHMILHIHRPLSKT